jgi:hypothetical protein
MRQSWLDETEGGWIPLRLRLRMSPAWVHRPIPVARVLDRLEIEHMQHAGKENGELCVSFDQFVEAGVSRKIVRAAEEAAEALGLLVVMRSDEIARNIRQPNKYRLTYVPEKNRRAPTDEWQDVTSERAEAVVEAFQKVAAGKRGPSYPRVTPPVPLSSENTPSSSSPFAQTPVTHGELPSISATSDRQRAAQRATQPKQAARASTVPAGLLQTFRAGEQPPPGRVALGSTVTTKPVQPEPVHISETLRLMLQGRGAARG